MNYWTICWKCDDKIEGQKNSNYIKTRNGNFDLCPLCYKSFIEHNIEFIQPERTKKEEIKRSFYQALSTWHDKLMEENQVSAPGGHKKVPPVLIHKGSFIDECDACKQILDINFCLNCEKNVY